MIRTKNFTFIFLFSLLPVSLAIANKALPDGLDHEKSQILMHRLRSCDTPFVQQVVQYYDNYQDSHTGELSSLIQNLQKVERPQAVQAAALKRITADLVVVDAVREELDTLQTWPEGMTHPFKANKHPELLRLAHHFFTVEWESWLKGECPSWSFDPAEVPILGAQDSVRGNAKESSLAMVAIYGLMADYSLRIEQQPTLMDLDLGFSVKDSTTVSLLNTPSGFDSIKSTALYVPEEQACFTTTSGYSFGGGRPGAIMNYQDGFSAPDCSSLIGWALGKRGDALFNFNTRMLNTVTELEQIPFTNTPDCSQLKLGDLYAPGGHVAMVVDYDKTAQTVTVFESNRNMADTTWDDALQTYMPTPKEALAEYAYRRNLEGIGFRIHRIDQLVSGASFYRVK